MIVERQVIVTWHKPEERLPEAGVFVVATISGKTRNITFDHALVTAEYYQGDGWCVEPFDFIRLLDTNWQRWITAIIHKPTVLKTVVVLPKDGCIKAWADGMRGEQE